jgi:TrmH family RNA methyltransferase
VLIYDSRVGRGEQLGHRRQGSAPSQRVTSAANPQIKAIRALAQRKERDRTGLFVVEGIRAVVEAIESGIDVERLVVAPDLLESAHAWDLVSRAASRGTPLLEVSAAVFGALSRKDGPQGIALVGRQRWTQLQSVRAGDRDVWVALTSPQDPGNVGTALRTADATGASGLVLVGASADPYDPAALRASTGAAFTLPLVRAAWGELVQWAREEEVRLVGASGDGAVPYRSANLTPPLALVMGSEREGLSIDQRAACDVLVRLPMVGRVDSLNLAVAAGVLLYEALERSGRA